MSNAKARSYCPYGEVRLIEDNEYNAWFDGACGPVNPGGTATFGILYNTSLQAKGRQV